MKYSIVAVSAMAAAVVAQSDVTFFTNTEFNVVEGEPFTLRYEGCDEGCTISLGEGSQNDVAQLTSGATGNSFTVTLEDMPSGEYFFYLINNETQEENYTLTFEFEGTGESPSSTSSSAPETTTSAEETSSSTVESTSTESSETSTSASSTVTTTVTTASSSVTSDASSSTESDEPSSTTEDGAAESTTPPDDEDAAAALGSSLTLALGVAAAVALF